MTARDVTGFSAGNRAIFSTFWGHFLTKLHSKPGEKGKIPLEKIPKNPPMELAPRNCRFLSLAWVRQGLTTALPITEGFLARSSQASPTIKPVKFQKFIPGNIFRIRHNFGSLYFPGKSVNIAEFMRAEKHRTIKHIDKHFPGLSWNFLVMLLICSPLFPTRDRQRTKHTETTF